MITHLVTECRWLPKAQNKKMQQKINHERQSSVTEPPKTGLDFIQIKGQQMTTPRTFAEQNGELLDDVVNRSNRNLRDFGNFRNWKKLRIVSTSLLVYKEVLESHLDLSLEIQPNQCSFYSRVK